MSDVVLILGPVISPSANKEEKIGCSELLKNVKIVLNGVHVRYEDDYYSKPFALGIQCDVSLS
jgi:hypothetical protein